MMGLANTYLAEVLDDERLRRATERSTNRHTGPHAADNAGVRHPRQRRLVGLSLLLVDRADRR